jgi:hypothetical protein
MYLYKKTSAYRSLKSNSNNDYAEVAADAVAVEPVSTAKFPANREKNREFFNFRRSYRTEDRIRPMISGFLAKFPTHQSRELLEQNREI